LILTAYRPAWRLFTCAVKHWSQDAAATTGAALAFYCAFSLAPLLIILVAIAAWVTDAQTAYGHLSAQLNSLFGESTAQILLEAMKNSQQTDGGIAAALSVGTLLLGATTVFAALEDALEHIWGSQALAPQGLRGWLRARLLSFGLILAVGFLLLVSLSLSTGLAALKGVIARHFTPLVVLTTVLDFAISTAFVTALIALIYRYMPARRMSWRPVLWGALVTALLFHLGRWLISLYLARAAQPSAFGAAASFVAMLLWLYYTAQIFLLGAEFTACLGGVRDPPTAKAQSGAAAEGPAVRKARAG